MATQEYYIRGANENEARGPFNTEQLHSLGEAGQISPDTLYYLPDTEEWKAISENETLMAAVFPAKRRLTVKAKDRVRNLNVDDETVTPIKVEDMLAAAEGRTSDTKDKRALLVSQERAAQLGLYGSMLILLVSSGALALPHIEAIATLDWPKIVTSPLAILGVVDAFLVILLGLQFVAVYPFLRFRAALGATLVGIVMVNQGTPAALAPLILGCTGLYFCTVFTRQLPMILAVIAGLGGMAEFARQVLT
jgi:hypothetical protein